VRRLVSEGSRPRLPWGLQLKALVADPSPTLPLLRALQDDPSEYVRRSVANHLNDIAKDHPALVADWLRTHLPDATPARRALLRHASRTLIKAGRPRGAGGLGAGQAVQGAGHADADAAAQLRVGEAFDAALSLQSTARAGAEAGGRLRGAPRQGRRAVDTPRSSRAGPRPGGGRAARSGQDAFDARNHHAPLPRGPHALDVRVNGRVVAEATFELLPAVA
jgi:hypothetical protein